MRVALLGPVEVHAEDGRRLAPAGARPRALLARLALAPGAVVSAHVLADALWGDDAPGANALHTVVSRLRRALAEYGDGAGPLVESRPSGYRLAVAPEDVDTVRAERLAGGAATALAAGETARATALAGGALALWRGDALADVDGAPFAAAEAGRLADLRLHLHELAAEAAVTAGEPVDLTELEACARRHPLREHLQAVLVRALYAAGRQADALAVYDRTRRALADELGVDPSPELQQVHLAVLRHDEAVRPAKPTVASRPAFVGRYTVPAQLTSFVGRDEEMERVNAALGASRLVTVVGPGGSGKTRLATETAVRRHDTQHDAIGFVELAPVGDAAALPQTVLAALGLREHAMLRVEVDSQPLPDPVERLVDSLAGADLLLVLDNCEHLVAAVAELTGTLLAGCPRVRVLATSREPLGITGETLCPLPPLALPHADVSAEQAPAYAAVRLFADRAAAVHPGFTVTGGNVAAVVEVCRRLDGLPLALELAAARTRALSVEQVAGRLGDRFRLLTGGSRTALPRHQTLGAVVDWSWELLEKPERLLLQELSVFAGPVTLEDVEQVCTDDDLPREAVLDLLTSLVDKSLVDTVGEAGDAEVRYRLLETVRAYAAERLAESGAAELVRSRHAEHLLTVARQADPMLRTAGQLPWLDRLDRLREDAFAALRWAVDTGDARHAVGLVAALGWYWTIRDMHAEALSWPTRVLDVPGDCAPEDRAVTHAFAAMGEAGQGSTDDAKAHLARAVELRRGCSAPYAHPALAVLESAGAYFGGDPERGARLLDRLAAEAPDGWVRAVALMVRAHLRENAGEVDAAAADKEAGHAAFRVLGERWGLAMAVSFLAEQDARRGDRVRAMELFREALGYLRELGAYEDVAMTLVRMAAQLADEGDLVDARRQLDEAAQISERLPVTVHRTMIDAAYAGIARLEGDLDRARALLEAAMERSGQAPSFGARQVRLMLLVALGQLEVASGRPAVGRQYLVEASRLAEGGFDAPALAGVAAGWAAWAVASGDARTGTTLLGATEAVTGTSNSTHLDMDRAEVVASARAALGDEAYERAYTEGSGLARDAALTLIRDWIADHRAPPAQLSVSGVAIATPDTDNLPGPYGGQVRRR